MTDLRIVSLLCPRCKSMQEVCYSPYAPEKNAACNSCGTPIPLPQNSPLPQTPPQPIVTSAPVPSPSSIRGSMTLAWKIVAGIVGGLILAALGSNITSLVLSSPIDQKLTAMGEVITGLIFFFLLIIGIYLAVRSNSPSRAWRKLLIPSGILSLILPLAALAMTFRMTSAAANRGGDLAAAAYASGGTVFAIIVGFFGVILGAVFLIVGLLVGKPTMRKECREGL